MKIGRLLSTSDGSRFRRNFLKVARANIIALALPLAATPIMTRLFAPDDYGALAIFTALLALLVAFCTWRFDWALPNARTMTMAASLFVAGMIVLAGTTLAIALLIPFVGPGGVLETAYVAQLGALIFLLPVALVGAGLRQMLSGWFVRKGDLSAVSHATIAQSVTSVLTGLGAGVLQLGALGLIAATVVSAWAGIGTLLNNAGWEFGENVRRVTRRSLAACLRIHGRNANWSTLVAIANALSLNAPVLVLAYFYLPREVGWYALMHRLVSAPTGALASALGQSFWSLAAEHARARRFAELGRLYRKTTRRLGLACLPVVAVCLMGPVFVGPVLGAVEWQGAGYVLAAMLPHFAGTILFSPTNHLVVLDMQHAQLLADIGRLVLIVASIGLASYMGLDFVWAVFLASSSSFIGNVTLFFIHLRIHAQHERH